jgi:hypothetical protein
MGAKTTTFLHELKGAWVDCGKAVLAFGIQEREITGHAEKKREHRRHAGPKARSSGRAAFRSAERRGEKLEWISAIRSGWQLLRLTLRFAQDDKCCAGEGR